MTKKEKCSLLLECKCDICYHKKIDSDDHNKKIKRGKRGKMGVNGPTGPTGPQGIRGLQGPTGINGINGIDGINGEQGPQGDSSILLEFSKQSDSTISFDPESGLFSDGEGSAGLSQQFTLNQNDKIILTSQFQYKYNNINPQDSPFQYGQLFATFYIINTDLDQDGINIANNTSIGSNGININNESTVLITKSNYIGNSESVNMTYIYNVPADGTYNFSSAVAVKYQGFPSETNVTITKSYLSIVKILGNENTYYDNGSNGDNGGGTTPNIIRIDIIEGISNLPINNSYLDNANTLDPINPKIYYVFDNIGIDILTFNLTINNNNFTPALKLYWNFSLPPYDITNAQILPEFNDNNQPYYTTNYDSNTNTRSIIINFPQVDTLSNGNIYGYFAAEVSTLEDVPDSIAYTLEITKS